MRTSLAAACLALALASGCGGDSSSGGPSGGDDDATTGTDAGGTPTDAGEDRDQGGPDPDAGVELDMAVGQDMGEAGDAGPDASADAFEPDAAPDTLCAPCDADDDCEPGAKCLEAGDGAKFCGRDCADDECPDGYTCSDEGEGVEQCRPATGRCGECADADGDGRGEGIGCLGPDCNEGEARAWTGAADGCDGVDNDCDGASDEDFQPSSCGVGACASQSRCENGAEVECAPGAAAADDTTCDGRDDDCSGEADEDYVPQRCGEGMCVASSACAGGQETACAPLPAGSPNDATCDGVDEDCDGLVDDDFVGEVCGVGACAVPGVCEDAMTSCEPLPALADDDTTCDGVDDDCDGASDEEFETEETCGLGVCRREALCGEGEVVCVPGEPISADDATCDRVDDNCDGRVDEDCSENFLGFEEVSRDAGGITVDVSYTRNAPPDFDDEQDQPRLVNLWINHPEGLTVPCENGTTDYPCSAARSHYEAGAAAVAANKDLTVQLRSATEIRVLILRFNNTERIHPGQLMRLRFDRAAGATGPFPLGFNREFTLFAPEEADAVLQVRDAVLPD